MVTKSVFKERKYKVKKNKLTKKKDRKIYKHLGGQNNIKPNESEPESLETTNNLGENIPTNNLGENTHTNNLNQNTLPNNLGENTLPTNNLEEQQGPAMGLFNKPDKQEPESELSKAIQKERGGLFVSYPPEINGDKEKALAEKLNLRDTREEGFTSYRGEMNNKIEPKFTIDNFYPKYLSYYKLQGKETNNTNNTSNLNNLNNLNNTNNIINPNTNPEEISV